MVGIGSSLALVASCSHSEPHLKLINLGPLAFQPGKVLTMRIEDEIDHVVRRSPHLIKAFGD